MHSDNTLLANGRSMVVDWGSKRKPPCCCSLSPMSHHIGNRGAGARRSVSGCELVMHDPSAGVKALDWIVETGRDLCHGGFRPMRWTCCRRSTGEAARPLAWSRCFTWAGFADPHRNGHGAFSHLARSRRTSYGHDRETARTSTPSPNDPAEVITGSVGKACAGYEIRLWQADSPDLGAAPGDVGEIGGRGGVLMFGLFQQPIGNRVILQLERVVHEWRSGSIRRGPATWRLLDGKRTSSFEVGTTSIPAPH